MNILWEAKREYSPMIGRHLQGRYQITAELGRGGMGVVYKAEDQLLNRHVAIKVLTQSGLEDQEEHQHLIQEAQATARLDHPHIVTVYDVLEVDGTAYLVMQFVEGETFVQRKPESIDDIITSSQQLCQAMDYAHNRGIVHRDIKPANVMITDDNSAMLMDFGLAFSLSTQLSIEGTFAGTMDYISPEQITGKKIDGRADLYSFGVMLYELVTGQLPFSADDPVSLLTQHLYTPAVPPRTKNEALPAVFNDLIVSLLEKDPDRRPPTAADVLSTFDQLAQPDLYPAEPVLGAEQTLIDRIVRGRLVSRQEEIKAARSSWIQARGGEGHTLIISGEPGIGKTRFVREVSTFAAATRGRTLLGSCYNEGATPYAPFVQIIRNTLESEDIASISIPRMVLAELLLLAPELHSDFPDLQANPPLEPEQERQRLFESIVTLINLLAQNQPLLVLIEDIHWADSGTAALLHHLSRRLIKQQVLIIATIRDGDQDRNSPIYDVLLELNRERLSTEIKLNRLDRPSTERLLEALFQEPVTSGFLDGIYRVTEGNPFFIEEVCKSMVESSDLYFEEGAWHRPDMGRLVIPGSIRAAVGTRVKRLPKKTQDALLLAAIIGRAFSYELLAQASDMEENDLVDALEDALKAQIIDEDKRSGDIGFSFVHNLIPTSLVEETMALRLRRLHHKVGEAYERLGSIDYEVMAYHFGQAGDDDKALTYLAEAGNHATSAAAHDEAAAHYQAALKLEAEPFQRAELLSALGHSLFNIGKLPEAITIWEEAVELFESSNRLKQVARLYCATINTYVLLGENRLAQEASLNGLAAVSSLTASSELAELLHETARAYLFNNNVQEAVNYCHEALSMAIATGSVSAQANTLITLGISPNLTLDEKVSLLNQAIELSRTAGLPTVESRGLNNRSILYTHFLCEIDNALKDMLRGEELAKQQGDLPRELYYMVGAIWTELSWGVIKLDEGIERLKVAEELVQALPQESDGWSRFQIIDFLISYYSGDWDVAAEKFYYLNERINGLNYPTLFVRTTFFRGKIHYNRGEFVKAIELMEKCLKISKDDFSRDTIILFALGPLASAYAWNGQMREARETITEADKLLETRDRSCLETYFTDVGKANLAAAEGRWTEAWNLFESVVGSFAELSSRTHQAETLIDWGNAHLHRGLEENKDHASRLFQEAHDIFLEIGAHAYASRVEARMSKLNAR